MPGSMSARALVAYDNMPTIPAKALITVFPGQHLLQILDDLAAGTGPG